MREQERAHKRTIKTSIMQQTRLVHRHPRLQVPPEVGDGRFINVPLCWVDLWFARVSSRPSAAESKQFTLSSVTFQLRTFVFGASLVHCTNTPFTADGERDQLSRCWTARLRERTVMEQLLGLCPLVWPKLPLLPRRHHTDHTIPGARSAFAARPAEKKKTGLLTTHPPVHQTC